MDTFLPLNSGALEESARGERWLGRVVELLFFKAYSE